MVTQLTDIGIRLRPTIPCISSVPAVAAAAQAALKKAYDQAADKHGSRYTSFQGEIAHELVAADGMVVLRYDGIGPTRICLPFIRGLCP